MKTVNVNNIESKILQENNRCIIESTKNSNTQIAIYTFRQLMEAYKSGEIITETVVQRDQEISKEKQINLIRNMLCGFNPGCLEFIEVEEITNGKPTVKLHSIDGNQRLFTFKAFCEGLLSLTPTKNEESDFLSEINKEVLYMKGNLKEGITYDIPNDKRNDSEYQFDVSKIKRCIDTLYNSLIVCYITKLPELKKDDDEYQCKMKQDLIETHLFCSYNQGSTPLTNGDLIHAKYHNYSIVKEIDALIESDLIINDPYFKNKFKNKSDKRRTVFYEILTEIATAHVYSFTPGVGQPYIQIPQIKNSQTSSFSTGASVVISYLKNDFDKDGNPRPFSKNIIKHIKNTYEHMQNAMGEFGNYLGRFKELESQHTIAYLNLDMDEISLEKNINAAKPKTNAALHSGLFVLFLKNELDGKVYSNDFIKNFTYELTKLRKTKEFGDLIHNSTKNSATVIKKLNLLSQHVDFLYENKKNNRNFSQYHSAKNLCILKEKQKNENGYLICALTGQVIGENDKFHVDHIIPLAKGGSDDIDNLQITLPKPNLDKGTELNFIYSTADFNEYRPYPEKITV